MREEWCELGFYDDHSQGRYKGRPKNKVGYFFASLVGAIIGALFIAIFTPYLSSHGMLPYAYPQDRNQVSQNSFGNNNEVVQKQMAVDVDTTTTRIVQKTIGAVVGVSNIQSQTSNLWSDGGGNKGNSSDQPAATGSGVIYKRAGNNAFIVTNNHVVAGATKLEVTLNDGTKLPAKLLGTDIWTDLAVLEINGSRVKEIAQFGDSDKVKIGEPAIAIGNPLGPEFSGSVTKGIISGLNRTIPVDINEDGVVDWQEDVIQTDAAINPGNSGGALINIDGQVIGINSMKIAQEAVEGIGLSIPINSAEPIINDLEHYGTVKRPYLGIDPKSVSEIPAYYQQEALKLPTNINYGVALRQVVANSPAARAGLRELDVIVELDGKRVSDVIALRRHLYQEKKIGDKMSVRYYRNGQLKQTTVTLAAENTPSGQ